ncbi:MAG: cupin domain-containing protein [Acidobacteria bacterium]|nr:cupin domain-containing protein [Acidobacteriota bacterium]
MADHPFSLDARQMEWQPSKHANVVFKTLRFDRASGSGTVLLRMAPGAEYPVHRHAGSEEVYVLEGEMTIEGTRYGPGMYLYSPPSSVHGARTEQGCTFLAFFTGKVEEL